MLPAETAESARLQPDVTELTRRQVQRRADASRFLSGFSCASLFYQLSSGPGH